MFYFVSFDITTLNKHFKREHKINVSIRNEEQRAILNDNVELTFNRQSEVTRAQNQKLLQEHLIASLDKFTLKYLYIK